MEQHQLNIALRKNNHELKGSTIILTTYLKIVDMFSIEMDMFADINLGTINILPLRKRSIGSTNQALLRWVGAFSAQRLSRWFPHGV